MTGKLTLDISLDTETEYLFQRVGGTGTSFAGWEFGDDFGVFQDKIVPIFEEAIDNTFKEEAPFYFAIPQISPWGKKPERPLTLEVHLGFDHGRNQHTYRSSLDERIALEFEMHRTYDHYRQKHPDSSEYSMSTDEIERYKEFVAALRELADKIDVELTKVEVEETEEQSDEDC